MGDLTVVQWEKKGWGSMEEGERWGWDDRCELDLELRERKKERRGGGEGEIKVRIGG